MISAIICHSTCFRSYFLAISFFLDIFCFTCIIDVVAELFSKLLLINDNLIFTCYVPFCEVIRKTKAGKKEYQFESMFQSHLHVRTSAFAVDVKTGLPQFLTISCPIHALLNNSTLKSKIAIVVIEFWYNISLGKHFECQEVMLSFSFCMIWDIYCSLYLWKFHLLYG